MRTYTAIDVLTYAAALSIFTDRIAAMAVVHPLLTFASIGVQWHVWRRLRVVNFNHFYNQSSNVQMYANIAAPYVTLDKALYGTCMVLSQWKEI